MRKWKRFSLIVLVAALLLFIAAVVAALALEPAAPAATDLSWKVIASGGATMSSPNYTMLSTAGQPNKPLRSVASLPNCTIRSTNAN